MEQENFNQEESQVEIKSFLHEITPFSKYLALALFIILPFVGGWAGYTLAPEKVVEIEKEILKQPANDPSNWALSQPNSQTKKDTPDNKLASFDDTPGFLLLESRGSNQITVFINKNFSLEFKYSPEQFKTANESNRGISVWFWDSDEKDRLPFMSLDAHHKDFCLWSLCKMETQKVVDLGGYSWEYVGGFSRRDGSETISSDHVYLYKENDIILYLRSDIALHENLNDQAKSILTSLVLDTEPNFIQLVQYQPIQIGSKTYGGEPVEVGLLSYDDNYFYVGKEVYSSISDGTYEQFLVDKGMFKGWIRLGDDIYALTPAELGSWQLSSMPSELGTDSFTQLGYGYARDSKYVYYQTGILEGVEPSNFTMITDEPLEDQPLFVSGLDVYYQGKILEDIDSSTLEVKSITDGTTQSFYIRDIDTIYFNRPVCNFATLEKGTFEELDSYNPVCTKMQN